MRKKVTLDTTTCNTANCAVVVREAREQSFWNGVVAGVCALALFFGFISVIHYACEWNSYFHREHDRVVQLEKAQEDWKQYLYRERDRVNYLQRQLDNCSKLPKVD